MPITFTLYELPKGRTGEREISIRDPYVLAKAEKLKSAKFVFELEILRTTECSFTIHHQDDDEQTPISWEICSNKPESVNGTVQVLINRAYKEVFETRKQENENGKN